MQVHDVTGASNVRLHFSQLETDLAPMVVGISAPGRLPVAIHIKYILMQVTIRNLLAF
jgi:hypothetical protein